MMQFISVAYAFQLPEFCFRKDFKKSEAVAIFSVNRKIHQAKVQRLNTIEVVRVFWIPSQYGRKKDGDSG